MIDSYFGNFVTLDISDKNRTKGRRNDRKYYYNISINAQKYIELILNFNQNIIDNNTQNIIKHNYSNKNCIYHDIHLKNTIKGLFSNIILINY